MCTLANLLLIISSILTVQGLPRQNSQDDSGPVFQRQAPFCVDDTNTVPYEPGLYRFEHIFDFHRLNSYVGVSPDGKTSPTGLIKNFEVKAITIDDNESSYKDTLRNWLHIKIEAVVPLEGLYVQAISTPWGAPFGEFMKDFDCGDCSEKTSKYDKFITIIPCIHRPALTFTHPNVFTVGGKKGKKTKFTEMHFHFKYTQYPCAEHTYVQFLVVAVKNFYTELAKFETFYTGIYELSIDDNEIGAYYPFYYGWLPEAIKCHAEDVGGDFKPYTKSTPKMKLRFSRPFEECTVKKRGKAWYTCPPGPIHLKDPPVDLPDWKNRFRNKYKSPDPALPEDAQLCDDCGVWKWTVGKAEWPIPPTVVVKEGGHSLTDVVVGVDDQVDACENVAVTVQTAPECFEEPDPNAPQYCTDVHAEACPADLIPAPTYGKDGIGDRIHKDWDQMTFSEQFDDIAWRWGQKHVLLLHGRLLIFAWTAAFNVIAFSARYCKELTIIEKKSSYWGIGNWLWQHMLWTYINIAASISGILLISIQHVSERTEGIHSRVGQHDLCNIRNTKLETDECILAVRVVGHRYVGFISVVLFLMSYVSGWKRPETRGLRIFVVLYHIGCAYLSKVFAILGIILVAHTMPSSTDVYIIIMEVASIIMSCVAACLACINDKNLDIDPPRTGCPFPEGVDTFENMRLAKIRSALLHIHAFVQITIFIILLIHT